jgi:hypothetical protein
MRKDVLQEWIGADAIVQLVHQPANAGVAAEPGEEPRIGSQRDEAAAMAQQLGYGDRGRAGGPTSGGRGHHVT